MEPPKKLRRAWNKGLKTGLVPKTAFKKGEKRTPEFIAKNVASRKGYRHSEETKVKMRLARLGKPSWSKGLTGIKRAKHVFAQRPNGSGKNHYKWIKDRTKIKIGERSLNDPLQKGWRKSVKNRDNWKCGIADENCSGRLEAHHILPWSEFPELRYEINNGITLCHHHHPRAKKEVVKLSPYFQQLVAEVN